jgi:hypothetical protein
MQGNVISLASRRAAIPGAMDDLERQDSITRLRGRILCGAIVYVVIRSRGPDGDWFVCDLYLIDGHRVAWITDDVGRALDCLAPHAGPGLKFTRPRGRNPLRELIDGSLSRLLFGERDQIRHQVIG